MVLSAVASRVWLNVVGLDLQYPHLLYAGTRATALGGRNLLILVQCVLLFQQKGRRIYEQMAVFCLLQLIVGAVINDALMFGVLLVPVTVLILSSLLLLQTWRPIDRTASGRILQVKTKTEQLTWSDVFASMRRALIPGWLGIVLIAAVSFYALPRARGMQPRNSGNVTIGFTDEITLDQLGKISGNTQIVMRMRLTQRETGQPYTLEDGAYLRGVVLDGYTADSANIGRWTTVNVRERQRRAALPEQFEAYKRKTAGYDVVDVSMDLEATDVRYLFSIPPYHENTESSDLFHIPLRWLLERSEQMDGSQQTKIDYGFGTHAFFRGRQTPWVRTHSRATTRTGTVPDLAVGDLHLLKTFSDERMPTVAKLAKRIVNSLPEQKRNPVDIANAFSSYLSDSGEFKYTRTLDKPPPEDTDPIEDFVSRTKLGHCQYFASALAMMLRSQQIPAQLVVGFRVHEYNPLGKFYIVRQQDAHCWVEAHISSNDIPESANLAGQVNRGGAWLRLDPTPADELGTAGQVGQAMDLAQSLWQEFVIEMNDKRQSRSVYGFMGSDSNMSLSIWERFQMTVTRLRAGQVDASDFSVQNLLSWQAAVITMVLGCLGMLCFAVLRWFGGCWPIVGAGGMSLVNGFRSLISRRWCDCYRAVRSDKP